MSVENFNPMDDRVLVEIEPVPETTSSGLYLAPSNQNQSTRRGRVIATGPNCAELEAGDVVLLTQRTGVEIDVQDSESTFIVIPEEHILGFYGSGR